MDPSRKAPNGLNGAIIGAIGGQMGSQKGPKGPISGGSLQNTPNIRCFKAGCNGARPDLGVQIMVLGSQRAYLGQTLQMGVLPYQVVPETLIRAFLRHPYPPCMAV